MNPKDIIKKIQPRVWVARALSILAALLYLIQSLYDAHYLDVSMDEGTYLMKGLLFDTGVYQPFQAYGPWTNKMPLAFMIPGFAQTLFEPGLRTGRYFAVFLSIFMVFGMWWVVRRLRGDWWAALTVIVMALSGGNISYYSGALSQGLVASMLVWVFVLVLGQNRSIWMTTSGAVLSALIVLTRQNMLPVIFFVVGYIFWEHGWRSGVVAAAASLLVLGVFHAMYWPEIMQIWLPYLPKFVRSFFSESIIKTGGAVSVSTQTFNTLSKLFVFWEGFRFNFFALAGSVACWIFWPKRKEWRQDSDFKAAVFLSSLLVVLVAAHLWASFFKDYCLYCYPGYLAFFIPTSFLLVAICAHQWNKSTGWLGQAAAVIFVVASFVGIGFGGYQVLDETVLNIQVPRMRNMRFLPGTVEMWRFLNNKFGWPYETLQQALPAVAGLTAGIVFILILFIILRMNKKPLMASFGYYVLISFWVLGTLFSPTQLLAGGNTDAQFCGGDVIASHEAVGAHLAELIPPGALVYWKNDVSPLPLLYLPGRQIFPPQLNHWYSYVKGGDSDAVYRKGLWNEELSVQWMYEADFLLIADKYVDDFNANQEFKGRVDELAPTPITVPCRDNSVIHVFRRIK